MGNRHGRLGRLGLLAILAATAPAAAQPMPPVVAEIPVEPHSPVPLDEVSPAERDRVRAVLERPTLSTSSTGEVFTCNLEHYYWLLEHPDQVTRLWHCMGIKCAAITNHGSYFSWEDGKGSDLRWHEVYRGSALRLIYAEGKVNPGFLLPTASIQAVLIIHHTEGTDGTGKSAIRQRVELALYTDSHALAAAARIIGASAPHLAQQYLSQVQTFYGAMAWYLNHHPRQAEALFTQLQQPPSTDHRLPLFTEE